MPSPTTILGVRHEEGLHNWRLRVGIEEATRKVETAARRGTAIHALIQRYIDGEPAEPTNEDESRALAGFTAWWSKHELITDIQTEVFVVSYKYKYAGRLDIICRINGVLWILDIKTSSSLKPGYGLQLRAYEQCIYENLGEHARMGVIHLHNNNKRGYTFKQYNEPLKVFIAHKTIFDWMRSFVRLQFDGRTITA